MNMIKQGMELTFNNKLGILNIPKVNDLTIDFSEATYLKETLYTFNKRQLQTKEECFRVLACFGLPISFGLTLSMCVLFLPLGFAFVPYFVFSIWTTFRKEAYFAKQMSILCHDMAMDIDNHSHSLIRFKYNWDPTGKLKNIHVSVVEERKTQ